MKPKTESLDRLFAAIDAGDLASLDRILTAEPDLANALGHHPEFQENDPWTPLVYAAYQGDAGACSRLLAAGAEVDEAISGTTALEMASGGPYPAVVDLLLEAGASVANSDGGRWAVLHHAASGGTAETARALLAKGADAEAVDDRGRRPLHLAASSRKVAIAELLLQAGARHDVQDGAGRTPLQHVLDRTGLLPSAHWQPLRPDEEAMMSLLKAGPRGRGV